MSKRDHGTRKWFLIKKLVTSVDVKTRSRYSEMVFNEIKKLDTSVDVKTRSRYSEMVFNKETRYKCRCQNEITVLRNGFLIK